MNRYLDMVDNPTHVKKLTVEQLQKLAEEIRQELITVLSVNGGHLGPNLGVVELTLALHHVFSTPKDKFVWDVSHQSYVHKLLTGRKNRFHTIRTTDGLCGFSMRTESEHDCYGAAHAGSDQPLDAAQACPGVVEEVPHLPREKLWRRISDPWQRVALTKVGQGRTQQLAVDRGGFRVDQRPPPAIPL